MKVGVSLILPWGAGVFPVGKVSMKKRIEGVFASVVVAQLSRCSGCVLCPAGAGAAPARGTGHGADSSAENSPGCPEEIRNKAGEQVVAVKTRV